MGRLLVVLEDAPAASAAPPAERRDAARNRRRILDAARRLMRAQGLHEMRMDDLATAAGVGKGTLYRRFADKSSLLLALLDEDERALQERVRARFGLPRSAPACTQIAALWSALVDFVIDHADVLAAAEQCATPGERLASPPYAWRHVELVRVLERVLPPPSLMSSSSPSMSPMSMSSSASESPALIADVLLASLSAELVRRAIQRSGVDVARSALHALASRLLPAPPSSR